MVFYSNCNRRFCKQTVEIQIRRRFLRRLIWVCPVCLYPKKDARLIWVKTHATQTKRKRFRIKCFYFQDSVWPLLTHFIAVLIAGISVTKGVKTIEKVSMVLVPLLLLIILFTFVWSLTREYADYGIKFLFSPKWGTFLH